MNTGAAREHPPIWAFWLACVLAAAGGGAPIALAGTAGRVSGVIVPFLVAAAAYAACAVLQSQGKVAVTGLYFLAGLATLYGILAMVAVPLRLAVLGTCPEAPAYCGAGLEPPLTAAENAGIGFAAGLGIAAVLVGFFGLVTLYRRLDAGMPAQPRTRRILPFTRAKPPESALPPPVRRIPPVVHNPAHDQEVVAAGDAPVSASPGVTGKEHDLAAAEPAAELAAPESQLELPAPAPELELPAPAPELELPAHGDAQPAEAPTQPAPEAKPRRKEPPGKGPTTPDSSAT